MLFVKPWSTQDIYIYRERASAPSLARNVYSTYVHVCLYLTPTRRHSAIQTVSPTHNNGATFAPRPVSLKLKCTHAYKSRIMCYSVICSPMMRNHQVLQARFNTLHIHTQTQRSMHRWSYYTHVEHRTHIAHPASSKSPHTTDRQPVEPTAHENNAGMHESAPQNVSRVCVSLGLGCLLVGRMGLSLVGVVMMVIASYRHM